MASTSVRLSFWHSIRRSLSSLRVSLSHTHTHNTYYQYCSLHTHTRARMFVVQRLQQSCTHTSSNNINSHIGKISPHLCVPPTQYHIRHMRSRYKHTLTHLLQHSWYNRLPHVHTRSLSHSITRTQTHLPARQHTHTHTQRRRMSLSREPDTTTSEHTHTRTHSKHHEHHQHAKRKSSKAMFWWGIAGAYLGWWGVSVVSCAEHAEQRLTLQVCVCVCVCMLSVR